MLKKVLYPVFALVIGLGILAVTPTAKAGDPPHATALLIQTASDDLNTLCDYRPYRYRHHRYDRYYGYRYPYRYDYGYPYYYYPRWYPPRYYSPYGPYGYINPNRYNYGYVNPYRYYYGDPYRYRRPVYPYSPYW